MGGRGGGGRALFVIPGGVGADIRAVTRQLQFFRAVVRQSLLLTVTFMIWGRAKNRAGKRQFFRAVERQSLLLPVTFMIWGQAEIRAVKRQFFRAVVRQFMSLAVTFMIWGRGRH